MQGDFNRAKSRFNANHAVFELMAGADLSLHWQQWARHFTTVRTYDPVEVYELNETVNLCVRSFDNKDVALNNAVQQADCLQSALDECRAQDVEVETVVMTSVAYRSPSLPSGKENQRSMLLNCLTWNGWQAT